MVLEIVILAMIAAFLGMRLYSVLGRRAEHEEEVVPTRFEQPERDQATQSAPAAQPARPAYRPAEVIGTATPVEQAVRAIAAADRSFDVQAFLQGARGAYQAILEAFWRGDKEDLSHLCDSDVYEGFSGAIDARIAAGEVLENRLVRIDEAVVVDANYTAPMARVTVRFTSDIAAVTRDANGNVVAGSLTDAVEAIDIWTFSRNVKSSDPDWLIDETDEG